MSRIAGRVYAFKVVLFVENFIGLWQMLYFYSTYTI